MSSPTRAAGILLLLTLAAIGASWHYWMRSMSAMRAESSAAHAKLEATLAQCQAAADAANQSLKAREFVHAQTQARLQDLASCLGNADSIAMPDSLRGFFQSHTPDICPSSPGLIGTSPPASPR